MSITQELLRFLVDTHLDQVPAEVQRRAKDHILDTLGVAVAGCITPAATIAQGYVQGLKGRAQVPVLGTRLRSAPPWAALANGVAAHALDYDDTSFLAIGHFSGSIVSALLALGEERGASGKAFLEAFILGHEFAARLGTVVMPAQYLRGWHGTGSLGVLGATAACAKLAGLGQEEVAHALGIASSLASGLRGNFGSHTKPLHTGAAAQNAVTAVSLASGGFTANPAILEDRHGYCAVTAGQDQINLQAAEDTLRGRRTWALVVPGVGIKLHPCNSAVLPGIDSTIEMAREHDIAPEEVHRVDYGHTDLAVTIVPFHDPQSSPQAMYSMTHAIAVALLYRRAGIAEFGEECVHRPEVRAMRARVHPYEHPDLKGITDSHDIPASHVTIHLKDGRSFTRFRRRPRAYPGGEPITRKELLEKFTQCAGLVLPRRRVKVCVELVNNLEQVKRVSEVARLFSLR